MIQPTDYAVNFLPAVNDEDIWFDRELVVSVCLSISEELKIEGTARHINRFVQDLRKKLNLPYDARIVLSVEADGVYQQSSSAHEKWLMEQSLAVKLKNSVESTMFEKNDKDGYLRIEIQKAL